VFKKTDNGLTAWLGGWAKGSDDDGVMFRIQGGNDRFEISVQSTSTNGRAIQSTNSVQDGNWHFVACVFDGASEPLIYRDGVLETNIVSGTAPGTEYWIDEFAGVGSPFFRIGLRPGVTDTQDYAGLIDEFVYFPGVQLTADEIVDLASSIGLL
jgi:hypothetical protein